MSTIPKTPLWLEIKTEYLDANLENVVDYLSRCCQNENKDEFFHTTLDLLRQRVQQLTVSLSSTAIAEVDDAPDKDETRHRLLLLGSYILSAENRESDLYRRAFFFFLTSLYSLSPVEFQEELVDIAIDCLTRKKVENAGFCWNDLTEFQPEPFVYRFRQEVRFSKEHAPEMWYQGHGSIRLADGDLNLVQKNRVDAALKWSTYSLSIPVMDEKISVLSPSGDKLKLSDRSDFDKVDRFTQEYIREMKKTTPSPDQRLRQYELGEIVPVRFTGVNPLGDMLVESVEGDHETVCGMIPARANSTLFYTTANLARFVRIGEVFDAEIIGIGKKGATFSVAKTLVSSIIKDVCQTQVEVLAVLKDIKRGQMTWWTADGYPAYCPQEGNGNYQVGDFAIVYISSASANGYVHCTPIGSSNNTFEVEDSKDHGISYFVYPEDYRFAEKTETAELGLPEVKGLLRLLFSYQKSLSQPSERYRILSVCRIMAAMTGDSDALGYIEFVADYLKDLVMFAENKYDLVKPLDGGSTDDPLLKRRADIVRILRTYGEDAESAFLSEVIHNEKDELLVKIAKLVQSCNRIDDVISASMKNVIKREITKSLAIETEENTNLEETTGVYLGIENSQQEFKTSFLVAPPSAYDKNQEHNIFRDVCSFLNTSLGGTLYLGVNDLGYINGLEVEMENLKKKAGNAYSGIDGYIRYIQDRARQYFDLDVIAHLKIEPLYDNQVVAISIEPYGYSVVEFMEVPYIRINSESVRMTQALRREIEGQRLLSAREKTANITSILDAIKDKRQMTFHNYSSSSSGEIKDYSVEPFALTGTHSHVWCYDLTDKICKQFKISRIGNAQILQDGWQHESEHHKDKTDVFHMSGKKAWPVTLDIDLMAKNLLVEEYPETETLVKPSLNEADRWILDTEVYSFAGITRFYVGLAEHIRIVSDSPELKKSIEDYLKKIKP